ncbi:MAG: SpoIIE family protein phosphatase [Planctomycetia bacterium]|nr:SpoIIE family protein phosphatase [Planctomycetia bacterium]
MPFFLKIFDKPDEIVPIRRKFIRTLSIYTSISLLISLLLSFYFEIRAGHREFLRVIEAKIDEAYSKTLDAVDTREKLNETLTSNGKYDVVAIATLLNTPEFYNVFPDGAETEAPLPQEQSGFEYYKTFKQLEILATFFDIDEINLTDEHGICQVSWPFGATEIGYDFASYPSTRHFLNILSHPELVISQDVRPSVGGKKTRLMQYSAAKRQDAPGIIEVGFDASKVTSTLSLADISFYVDSKLGINGFLCVYEHGLLKVGPESAQDYDIALIPQNKPKIMNFDGRVHLVLKKNFGHYVILGAIPLTEIYSSRSATIILLLCANFVLIFSIFALISILVQRLFVDNVYKVNRSLVKITDGDLDERVEVMVTKEFADLSLGVNATVDSLKDAASEIERRRLEEMALAHRIQKSALPNLDRLFPNREQFDVSAANHPMTSVGGDMYDFFYINDSTILFYVADVSGHGVPGALIMMKTMALVKDLALTDRNLEDVIQVTNHYLSVNNDFSFVTGFFCQFDLITGELTYVNAGHNPPFLKRADGSFEVFEPEINLIMGIAEDAQYSSATMKLYPGDQIVLYSDGITEAPDPVSHECFEVERAIRTLNGMGATASANDSVKALFDAVDEYTDNQPPSDDETILLFRFLAPLESTRT